MAAALKVSRVQKKGQVTIPAEIRNKLGLEEGDLVAFVETAQGVMLRAQALVPADALDKLEANWRQSQAQGERPEPFDFVERLKQGTLPTTESGTPAAEPSVAERTFGAFPAVEHPEDVRAWRRRFEEESAAQARIEREGEA